MKHAIPVSLQIILSYMSSWGKCEQMIAFSEHDIKLPISCVSKMIFGLAMR